MKKHYIRTLIIASLLSSTLVHSQSLKETTADKYYDLLSYAKAVDYYKELASDKKASPKNIRRAAECYQKLNDPKKASEFYGKLVNTNAATQTDFYNYSQVLKSLGNYSKADEYMQRIIGGNTYPLISKRHAEYKNYDIDLKRDSINYTLTNANINFEENDFSLFINNSDVYFTSSRKNVSGLNKTFAWDDSYFLDEYKGKFENGKIINVRSMPRDIDSKYHEGPGIVSEDGNTLYITRSNYLDKKLGKDTKRQINLKIYIAKKDEKGNWGKFENFPFNNDEYSVGHPALSKDGKIMYFVSDMPGGYGQTDLYETHIENGTWTKPTNLGQAINSEGREMFPYVFGEEGVLFFSSDGNAGLGGLDLYFAAPQQDQFFTPQNLGYPINTQSDDFGMFLYQDMKSGFISSNRIGGNGKDDIYTFTSKEPIIPQYNVEGIVADKYTNAPLVNANVDLYDETGNIVKTIKTDDKGRYKFPLLAGNIYNIEALKDEYLKERTTINTKDPNQKSLKNDIKLDLSGVYALVGIVTNSKTKQPLNNVGVLIKDNKTGQEVLKALTTESGDFEKMLERLKPGDLLDYEIQLQKEGYSIKSVVFTQNLGKPGVIKISELLDMSLTPTAEGDVFTINPIFFDLDKSSIRHDAQIELDKLVEILNSRKDIKIDITAATDCRASDAYNMSLSQRRASSAANYLVSKGINKSRLKIKYVGESQLSTTCPCDDANKNACTEEQHQFNRRADFKVSDLKVNKKNSNSKM